MSENLMQTVKKVGPATANLLSMHYKVRGSYGSEWPAMIEKHEPVIREYAAKHNVDIQTATRELVESRLYTDGPEYAVLLLHVGLELRWSSANGNDLDRSDAGEKTQPCCASHSLTIGQDVTS